MKNNDNLIKAMNGVEYIIYKNPRIMYRDEVLLNYPDGGVIFYKSNKTDPGKIEVKAYANRQPHMNISIIYGVLSSTDEGYIIMMECETEFLDPVPKVKVNFDKYHIYSFHNFFVAFRDRIMEEIDLSMRVYKAERGEVRLYVQKDTTHKGIIYYGFSIGELPEEYRADMPNNAESLSIDSYEACRKVEIRNKTDLYDPGDDELPDLIIELIEYQSGL